MSDFKDFKEKTEKRNKVLKVIETLKEIENVKENYWKTKLTGVGDYGKYHKIPRNLYVKILKAHDPFYNPALSTEEPEIKDYDKTVKVIEEYIQSEMKQC